MPSRVPPLPDFATDGLEMLGSEGDGMDSAMTGVGERTKVRRRLRKSPLFTLLGLLMLVLAVAGFWPQYFSAVAGRAPAPTTQFWLIHLHATLFTVWMLLYISQAGLVLAGQTRLHLKFGPWLAGYGLVIALVGVYAAGLLAHRLGVRENDPNAAASFVLFPLIDMVFFAGFLTAAVAWRKRPDLHKRAMLVATFSIAVVGLGRLVYRTGIESAFLWQPMTLAPLLIALAYDLYVCRKLYSILVIGLAAHLLRLNAEPFADSEIWLPVGRLLVAPFG